MRGSVRAAALSWRRRIRRTRRASAACHLVNEQAAPALGRRRGGRCIASLREAPLPLPSRSSATTDPVRPRLWRSLQGFAWTPPIDRDRLLRRHHRHDRRLRRYDGNRRDRGRRPRCRSRRARIWSTFSCSPGTPTSRMAGTPSTISKNSPLQPRRSRARRRRSRATPSLLMASLGTVSRESPRGSRRTSRCCPSSASSRGWRPCRSRASRTPSSDVNIEITLGLVPWIDLRCSEEVKAEIAESATG